MDKTVTANVIAYAPFAWREQRSGIMEGFDVDIIRAIGEEVGIQVRIQETTWEKIFFNLLDKKCDLVIAALTITEQRLETIIFSDPYLTSGQIITVPKGSMIQEFKDLTEKKIGVLKNTTGDFRMTELEEELNLSKINRYVSKTRAFKSLHKGEVDAVVIDQPLALYFIKNHPEFDLAIVGNIFTSEDYAIALRKESVDLRDTINLGLKRIKEKGIYLNIYNKYFFWDPVV